MLEDQRVPKGPISRYNVLTAYHGQRFRCWNAEARQRLVLRNLADLKTQRPAVIHDRSSVPLEPSKNGTGIFGCVAMITRVRGRAHAIVEHALRWGRAEIQYTLIKEPLLEGCSQFVESGSERFHPDAVFVNDIDLGHKSPPGSWHLAV